MRMEKAQMLLQRNECPMLEVIQAFFRRWDLKIESLPSKSMLSLPSVMMGLMVFRPLPVQRLPPVPSQLLQWIIPIPHNFT